MIKVPAIGKSHEFLLHEDSEDERLVYVDEPRPRPRDGGRSGGWMMLPGSDDAFFVGELEFGFSGRPGARGPAFMEKRQRAVSMPWKPSPVVMWSLPPPEPGGARTTSPHILGNAKTSGYGAHNCVLQSRPCSARQAGCAVMAAAVLECPAVLAGGGVDAELAAEKASAALRALLKERPEAGQLPLGYALGQVLRMLLARQAGSMRVRSHALSPTALESMRDLVVEEWTHRIAASTGRADALARPLGAFALDSLRPEIDLAVRWSPGDRVSYRAIRMHRFPAMKAATTCAAGTMDSTGNPGRAIELCAHGNWKSFDFAEVCLRFGEKEEHRTLSRDSATATVEMGEPGPGGIEVTALGGVSGFARKVALASRWAARNRLEISLPALVEIAFLLKAERSWLRTTGTLGVAVSHDGMAGMLTPADGVVKLDPCTGDLDTVSAVVRALVRADRADDPFHFTIELGAGRNWSWSAHPVDGDLLIPVRQMPQFRASCIQGGILPVAMEVGVTDDSPTSKPGDVLSLGERPIRDDTVGITWVLPRASTSVRLRCRFEHGGQAIVTPWLKAPVDPRKPFLVPTARMVEVVALAHGSDAEIEIAAGEEDASGPCHACVRVGNPAKLQVLRPPPAEALRVRTRKAVDGVWSPWISTTARVLAIHDGRVAASPAP